VAFHTLTIDEGHRLKNEASALAASLARVRTPFRLLLTGTPLQNNLTELWALLTFILPRGVLTRAAAGAFEAGACVETGELDSSAVGRARRLLGVLMLRRVKSDVETSLLPKIEFVLKPPLTALQRSWYRAILDGDEASAVSATSLLTTTQLLGKLTQLQKVCNHPKAIALTADRARAAARKAEARAAGSEFIQLAPTSGEHLSAQARADEASLRSLRGASLIAASGKLALLDRLLRRARAAGSRVLLFSQFTLTLDVLEEYVRDAWGACGESYFRLDGSTNRIAREMDLRAFNGTRARRAAGRPRAEGRRTGSQRVG
jgi:SWI/SNF-related matrix-associated actin-dependent regulator of chromatin subfamily A member 5